MGQVQTESRMTESERHEKILEFIRKYPGKKTKADVMTYMTKEHYSSPPTAFKDLTNLIKAGRILVLKDKPNSQIHYLIVNDENLTNVLEESIAKVYKTIMSYKANCYPALFKHREYRDFAIWHHLMIYSLITSIALLTKVELGPKRETLYPRLVELLEVSNNINDTLAPSLFFSVNDFLDKINVTPRTEKIVKDLKISYKKLNDIYRHLRITRKGYIKRSNRELQS
jgi:hypothetical protein